MKANKAPDKIYIADEENLRFEKSDSEIAFSYKPPFDSIEYTRTDAFIEKAEEYFSKHQCKYIDFDDFKNYMKGE